MLFAPVPGSPYYALSSDESLNKSQQSGQKDIHVRFWNSEIFQLRIPRWCES